MAVIDQIQMNNTTYDIVPEIAPLFSTSESYSVGDWVIKDAVLYKFTSAHPAGAWTGQDVESTVICDELDDIKSDLNNKADAIISSASGSIAHFEDGSESDAVDVVAHINPVQDLHGYDNPWPAGGGVNKFDESTVLFAHWINSSGTESTQSSYGCVGSAIPVTGGTNVGVVCFGNTPFSLSVIEYATDNTFIQRDHFQNTTTATVTLQENTAYIKFQISCGNDSSSIMDSTILATYKAVLYLGSTIPTEYMPYSNICPISGFTEMNITGTGKNQIDDSIVVKYSNTTIAIGNNYDFSIFLKAGIYTLSVEFLNDTHYGAFYRSTKDSANTTIWPSTGTINSASFTLSEDEWYRIWLYRSSPVVDVNDIGRFQLELGSTATDYEPYQGESHLITFPTEAGTVYGGYVDPVRGKLVVDRVKLTKLWSQGDNSGAATDIQRKAFYLASGEAATLSNRNLFKCNIAPRVNNTGMIGFYPMYTTQFYLTLPVDTPGSTSIEMLYPLATPITYDLTPTQITTLLGVNNIWNDTNGDTDVEYKADTKLYIEQLTKPTEDDMTANSAITSGKFFMIGNRLFISTSTIASGDTINPGTNCTELSFADALNSL